MTTAEQRAAAVALAALAAPHRFRVARDVEGWPIIPGRLGRIEHHDGRDLAVYTNRRRVLSKIFAVPGVRRHQTGDDEARMLFPPAALEAVARVIGARRRRVLSSAEARRRGFKPTLRATSGVKEAL